ncbi:MAG TPA: hypothetical protein PK869_14930 [Candidatus Hydrogenedentes bacterium]|nr:hypothetical protein [Candidatus Hydrogenedentota bacterium]
MNPVLTCCSVAVLILAPIFFTGCPLCPCEETIALATPVLLSPEDGSVFDTFPRDTTFQWEAVPDAVSYTIEIDCYICCADDEWCADIDDVYFSQSGIIETEYEYSWVGAQPGRWRVKADSPCGEGEWSEWFGFAYTI